MSLVGGCAYRSGDFGRLAANTAALTVLHKAPTGRPLDRPPFRYMHYYRTEVRNVSDRPLKIVWFEGYREVNGTWYPGNVLGRVLREEEFSSWYTEGDKITHGIIPPGRTAVCDVNWYGSDSPGPIRSKWAFIAVDAAGNDYYAERSWTRRLFNASITRPRPQIRPLTRACSGRRCAPPLNRWVVGQRRNRDRIA
jgi:hypothetical protein